MLMKKLKLKAASTRYLRDAFLHPVPRITAGRLLIGQGITAAIDVSDGLLADLRHICEASRAAARLEISRLPIHQTLKASFGEKAVELALAGGEDYELLFTGSIKKIDRIKAEIDCPVTVIGEITAGKAGEIDLFNAEGTPVKINKSGWSHF